jgi:hypothetical protein
VAEQRSPNVAVAKATRDVVTVQHGPEQPHVVAPRRIEAGI